MLMNNLDPDVAERPDDLVVYGGTGKAARNWASFDAICRTLRALDDDETLLVQSGKPVAVFTTHADAPRVLIANANLRSEEHTSELQSQSNLVCRLLLEKKKVIQYHLPRISRHIREAVQSVVSNLPNLVALVIVSLHCNNTISISLPSSAV